ncbi:MAG: toll/interleukin-1 receptor domain-containing protein [Pseudomonadota bacterium]
MADGGSDTKYGPDDARRAAGPARYRAFISYSHKDSAVAAWLARKLETWRAPGHFKIDSDPAASARNKNPEGRNPLGPIFRDREELAATHSLSDTIQTALAQSEWLIVLCSPHARASRWVNQEIETFTRLHGPKKILAVIVDGEPLGSVTGKGPDCFPESLGIGRAANEPGRTASSEPCAADLRDVGDGRRLGFLKLAAGMMDVNLDALVRRDLIRRNRTVTTVTAASLSGMILMGGLALAAWNGQREAERQRAEAEGLIEFMLTDLRDRLEPVGRLDVLQVVADKASTYFQNTNSRETDSFISGRARVDHLIGDLHSSRGDIDAGVSATQKAYAATKSLLTNASPSLKHQHAEIAFTLATQYFFNDNTSAAQSYLNESLILSTELNTDNSENRLYQLLDADIKSFKGIIALKHNNDFPEALTQFHAAISQYQKLLREEQDSQKAIILKRTIADRLTGIADIYENLDDISGALEMRADATKIHHAIQNDGEALDWHVRKDEAFNQYVQARLFRKKGDLQQARRLLDFAIAEMTIIRTHEPDNKRWENYQKEILIEDQALNSAFRNNHPPANR